MMGKGHQLVLGITEVGRSKRVRVINADPTAYTDVAVKLTVAYDSDMQQTLMNYDLPIVLVLIFLFHWIELHYRWQQPVWVKVPTLATSSATEIFMYYGNVSEDLN